MASSGLILVLRTQLVVLLDHLAGSVQLGDKIVDVGIQCKCPIDIILVCRLATFISDRVDATGKIIVVIGNTNIDREIAIFELRAFDRQANAEGAAIFVAECAK